MPTRSLLVFAALGPLAAAPAPPKLPSTYTPSLRAALGRAYKVVDRKDRPAVEAAVAGLLAEVPKHDPRFVVQAIVADLMRLAPSDARTRRLLHDALKHGWLEPSLARAFLVQSGEDARPHVAALLKALDSPDASARRGALRALAHCGEKAEAALPRLRRIVRDAKAPPSDYRRAFTIRQEVPEHVLAHMALTRIEYLLGEKR
jgi:hypothetical protein